MSIDTQACTQKVLEFQSNDFGANANELSAKFNKCISELLCDTKSLVFLISPWHPKRSNRSMHVSVLGSTVLEEDICFEGKLDSFIAPIAKGKSAMLPTSILDENLTKRISMMMLKVPDSFLCVPFKPTNNELIYFICCVLSPEECCECMDLVQTRTVEYMLKYCGNALSLAILKDEKTRLYKQGLDLLAIAERLFQNLDKADDVMNAVMGEARKLVNAERCALFLVKWKEGVLKAKVFEGVDKPLKLSIEKGIAGHVAHTGQLMNVRDAYKEPLFYRKVDEVSGFKTRSMLCIPILCDNVVIAVAQLCNKIDQPAFTDADEEICGPFATYCGISIKHTMLYDNVLKAKARQNLTNELMLYHRTNQVTQAEKNAVLKCDKDHRALFHYDDFSCTPLSIEKDHTICVVFEMFDKLRILHTFEIPKNIFLRFLLFIKYGYRDTPYHNWTHAFSTTHFGYLEITNFKLIENGYISLLEAMAYLVACLGHDIDHRGTTNSFQSNAGTALASLYSSQGSVMERHHFHQTMSILHLEECNIFEHVEREDYSVCVAIINTVILATDLANHFRSLKDIKSAFGSFEKEREDHKVFLLSLMVTGADLSMQTKDWPSVRQTAKCLYQEYFRQGDLEVAFGISPTILTDRRQAKIPQQQIEFLTGIVMPVFETMQLLFLKEASRLITSLDFNIKCWKTAINVFESRHQRGEDSLQILSDNAFEEEVLARAKLGEVSARVAAVGNIRSVGNCHSSNR